MAPKPQRQSLCVWMLTTSGRHGLTIWRSVAITYSLCVSVHMCNQAWENWLFAFSCQLIHWKTCDWVNFIPKNKVKDQQLTDRPSPPCQSINFAACVWLQHRPRVHLPSRHKRNPGKGGCPCRAEKMVSSSCASVLSSLQDFFMAPAVEQQMNEAGLSTAQRCPCCGTLWRLPETQTNLQPAEVVIRAATYCVHCSISRQLHLWISAPVTRPSARPHCTSQVCPKLWWSGWGGFLLPRVC